MTHRRQGGGGGSSDGSLGGSGDGLLGGGSLTSLTPGTLPWMMTVSSKGNRSELRPLLSDYYSERGLKLCRPQVSETSEESSSVLPKTTEWDSTLSGEGVEGVPSDQLPTNTVQNRPAPEGEVGSGPEGMSADVSEGISGGGSEGMSESGSECVMSESSALSRHRRVLSDLRETPSCGSALGSCEGRRNCPKLLWVIQRYE